MDTKETAKSKFQTRACVLSPLVGVVFLAASLCVGESARADNNQVRWDLINFNFTTMTATPAGNASAFAQDGSQIKLTGSGTFRSNSGNPQDVTGGGTWTTYAPDGSTVTGSGTYEVTGIVSFVEAPGSVPPTITVSICAGCVSHSGLAALQIAYSDGSDGVLKVSCHLPVGSPKSMPEGISASKGFVDYWNIPTPVAGVNTGRTQFSFLP
jgi:hypothetical protein